MCSYCYLLERSEGNKLLVLFLIGSCFFLVLFFQKKINMWFVMSLVESKELWLDSFLIVEIICQHLSCKGASGKTDPMARALLAGVNVRPF